MTQLECAKAVEGSRRLTWAQGWYLKRRNDVTVLVSMSKRAIFPCRPYEPDSMEPKQQPQNFRTDVASINKPASARPSSNDLQYSGRRCISKTTGPHLDMPRIVVPCVHALFHFGVFLGLKPVYLVFLWFCLLRL